MTQVDLEQAQERFLELVELAAGGEEVIISKDQRPLVRLTPILGRSKQRRFGSARGMIHMAPDFDEPLEDFKEYM
jgi:antitoxin (DNA-binding transcriptional repressor) of toxin-antitoxin stability system